LSCTMARTGICSQQEGQPPVSGLQQAGMDQCHRAQAGSCLWGGARGRGGGVDSNQQPHSRAFLLLVISSAWRLSSAACSA
jgi:hypothetical protein